MMTTTSLINLKNVILFRHSIQLWFVKPADGVLTWDYWSNSSPGPKYWPAHISTPPTPLKTRQCRISTLSNPAAAQEWGLCRSPAEFRRSRVPAWVWVQPLLTVCLYILKVGYVITFPGNPLARYALIPGWTQVVLLFYASETKILSKSGQPWESDHVNTTVMANRFASPYIEWASFASWSPMKPAE